MKLMSELAIKIFTDAKFKSKTPLFFVFLSIFFFLLQILLHNFQKNQYNFHHQHVDRDF